MIRRILTGLLLFCLHSTLSTAQPGPGDETYAAAKKAAAKRKSTKAARLYAEAAAQGNTDASYTVGIYYLSGTNGYPKDMAKVIECWTKTALNPYGELRLDAMYELAWRLYAGFELPQDIKQALMWYEMAAAGGHIKSMTVLGRKYAEGDHVPQNEALAVILLKQAALGKDPEAMWILGGWYGDGLHLPKDVPAAKYWLQLAIDAGESRAENVLRRLNGQAAVYDGPFDYRKIEQQEKAAREHPIVRTARRVSSAESEAYDAWWEKTYGGRQSAGNTPPAESAPAAADPYEKDNKAHQQRMDKFYSDWDKERARGKF